MSWGKTTCAFLICDLKNSSNSHTLRWHPSAAVGSLRLKVSQVPLAALVMNRGGRSQGPVYGGLLFKMCHLNSGLCLQAMHQWIICDVVDITHLPEHMKSSKYLIFCWQVFTQPNPETQETQPHETQSLDLTKFPNQIISFLFNS